MSLADGFDRYSWKQKALIRDRCWYEEVLSRGSYCFTCARQIDPRVINNHHIAGRKNSDLTITVCPTCHSYLSLKQRSWPEYWTSDDNPPLVRVIMLLYGLRDVVGLVFRNINELINDMEAGDGEH